MSQAIEIRLANGTEIEAQTREMLLSLLGEYPLDKWRYTETVRIEDNVIPHSHPVLTLNTFTIGHPIRLLSTYIHEQLHWFSLLESHEGRTRQAWRWFREAFPDIPVDPPKGCGNEFSNYLHVAINFWELTGLGELIGEDDARAFMARRPYYTAVYDVVLREGDRIGAILDDLDLMPPDLPPADKRFVTVDDTDRDWSIASGRCELDGPDVRRTRVPVKRNLVPTPLSLAWNAPCRPGAVAASEADGGAIRDSRGLGTRPFHARWASPPRDIGITEREPNEQPDRGRGPGQMPEADHRHRRRGAGAADPESDPEHQPALDELRLDPRRRGCEPDSASGHTQDM